MNPINSTDKHLINISKPTEELRRLILENPDLPIVVMSSYEAMSDEWYWTYCSNVSFSIDEYMSYDVFDDGMLETDRDHFKERLQYKFEDLPECENMSDEEFDKYLDQKYKEYEPYWKKAIFICADN